MTMMNKKTCTFMGFATHSSLTSKRDLSNRDAGVHRSEGHCLVVNDSDYFKVVKSLNTKWTKLKYRRPF